nr:hypothetical protein Iba_chr15dCG1140 [Ipomoea batatas]
MILGYSHLTNKLQENPKRAHFTKRCHRGSHVSCNILFATSRRKHPQFRQLGLLKQIELFVPLSLSNQKTVPLRPPCHEISINFCKFSPENTRIPIKFSGTVHPHILQHRSPA